MAENLEGALTPRSHTVIGGSTGTVTATLKINADGSLTVTNPDGSIIASGVLVLDAEGTPGSAHPTTAVLVGGSDGTNLRRVATDSAGIVKVDIAGQDVTVTTNPTRPATAACTNVASSATSVTLLSALAGRLGATVFNDSTQVLYIKFGTTASATSYTVQVAASGYYEVPSPVYSGRIDAIWASANGNARITELSA